MATSVRTVTIDNVSAQLVNINYSAINVALSVTDVPYQKSGTLTIPSKAQVTIEQNRIDAGQLENLEDLGLIKTTDGLISS